MNNSGLQRLRLGVLALLALVGLASCDTMDAFVKKEGSATAMAKNSAEAPGRVEAVRQREAEIYQLVRTGEGALGTGDLAAAEQSYRALETLDPGNLRAAEGLRQVDMRRRHAGVLEEAKALLGKTEDEEERAALLLREVLVENPDNVEARALYKGLLAKLETRRIESMRKRLAYQNPVTLEFRDVGLKVIIEALARGTGVNFILDKDVRSDQKATLFVKSVSLEDALDMLVQSNRLQKKILNEQSVIIYPNNPNKVREYQDLVMRSFFLEYADPKTVASMLKSMLGLKQVQTDDRLPTIMIKDVPEIMVLAEKLIASQDVAEPEVMLELEVLEVQRTRDLNLGVTWPTQLSVLPADGLTLDALKKLGSPDIGVGPSPGLSFRGADANINLLANPRIRVKNREKARIHIGDRVPIITSNVSSTGVISENVQYIDTGLKLEVEPTISLGGDVSIKLNLDVSSIGTSTTTRSGSVVYQIGTRSTSTQLRLADGETQILAGLISDEDRKNVDKIPGLGDIPLLGRLFSNHGDEKTKTEIVLAVTPRIIRSRPAPDADLVEFWSGSDTHAGRPLVGPRPLQGMAVTVAPRAGSAATPAKSAAEADSRPRGLNVPLPPGLASPLENGPGSADESENEEE